MDLFFSPISAYSHKTLTAFYEKGIDFTPHPINLADQSQREAFRQQYPMGKLPCLKTSQQWIGESTNIVEWLDNHFQVNKLIPEKAELARQVRYWDRIADLYIIQNAINLFFLSLKPAEQQDLERKDMAMHQIAAAYDMLEQALNLPNSVLGSDRINLADIALASGLVVSQAFVSLSNHPKSLALLASVQKHPAFIKAREGFENAVEDMIAAKKAAA